MPRFKLVSDYKPKGDQPQAIRALNKGLDKGMKHQTLLGVTGSGKTFAMANTIVHIQKSIQDMLGVSSESKEYVSSLLREGGYQYLPTRNIPRVISDLERQMKEAADNLEFEIAAMLRDEIMKLKEKL